MYTKQQASQLRQAFWTAFGKYMQPVPNADGEKVNWINYKTGIRHIYFRMNADSKQVSVSIQLTHPETAERLACFEQFFLLRQFLHDTTGEAWHWEPNTTDEHGRELSSISLEQTGVNVFQQQSWPAIISFLKPRIIALDVFWQTVKLSFE